MKYVLLFLLTLLPAAAMAETYEQAFVACSEQAANADDHSAAVQACMAAKGFAAQPDSGAPKQ